MYNYNFFPKDSIAVLWIILANWQNNADIFKKKDEQPNRQKILLSAYYFLSFYADINNRTIKVDSKEGLEAYGYDKLYKVQAVAVIPRLRKTSSEDEKRQSKQNSSDSLSNKFFSEVFDEACKKEEQKNIRVQTNGYTKNALPFYYNINMREYC